MSNAYNKLNKLTHFVRWNAYAQGGFAITTQPAPVIKKLCVKGVMEFNDNYGVYVCPHVFKKESPIFVSIRDPYGDWQFFCDDENCPENSKPHLVGAGHLTQADPTINELTCLKPGSFAQKIHANANWEYGDLE